MTERMGLVTAGRQDGRSAALARRAELRPAARRLAAVAVGFAGGWAVLYGALMPFGLGFVLGFAEDCFAPCAAGAALGMLLHGFGALSLRSVCMLCALGAAVAARWMGTRKLAPAALAGCGTLVGMALCFAFGGEGTELVLYSAADALLAAAIGFCLRQFAPEKPGAGMLLVGAAAAAALGSVQLWQLQPGVIACAALELYLCSKAQVKAALAASAMLGAALCAADPALSFAAAGLACATAAAVVLAPGRRMEAAAAYAGGCVTGALCVQPPGSAFQYLLNVCIGITAMALMPARWLVPEPEDKTPPRQAQHPQYSAAATRLEQVSQSLASLAETVNDVYDTLPHRRENFRWVIDNTHDTLCFNCGRRDTCWKQEYAATLEGMEALRPLLEQNGGLETAQLPGQLSRCIHPAACERSIGAVLADNAVVLADSIVENVLQPLLTPVITLVLFFLFYALLRLLVSMLVTVLGLVNKLPVIGTVNRGLGWLVGAGTALLDVYLVLCILWGLIVITGGSLNVLNDTVMSTSLYYKIFNLFNPFL